MTTAPALRAWTTKIRDESGAAALLLLAAAGWILVGLAQTGRFGWWPIALLPAAGALAAAGVALWRSPRRVQLAVLLLIVLSALLYLPPAQHLALSGDAAIYPNEAAWLARTHALAAPFEPLTPLSMPARDLFYIDSDEQFTWQQVVQSYKGLVYGGFYVADETTPTIRTSRMPLAEVWQALLIKVAGLPALFRLSPAAAALALILLFSMARRLHGDWIGLWVALLIAVTWPQIHFARQPLAEVVGQVWTLAGFWFGLRWLSQRSPWTAAAALLMWATAWSARVDAVLLVGPALLLALVAAQRRDGRTLRTLALTLPVVLLLGILGNNPAYSGATLELFSRFLGLLVPAFVALGVLTPLLVAVAWRLGPRLPPLWKQGAPIVSLLLFAPVAFVVLWSTLPNPLRDAAVTRNFQEILWFSSAYVSPGFYWLALAGVGLLLWQGLDGTRFFLLGALLGLGAAYFYTYTSANVYPVSLRRLIGEVFPLTALVAGYALALLPRRRYTRFAQGALAITALLWVFWLALPAVSQHEATHEAKTIAALRVQLRAETGDNAVLIFETQDDNSWVGWLAAPLYSIYGDWALVLESDTPDPALLARAVREWQEAGRTVYLVTQQDDFPPPLAPPGVSATAQADFVWNSSLVGQTRQPYPPSLWEFSHPLHLYRLQAEPFPGE